MTTAATRGESRAACSSPATRSCTCHPALTTTIRQIDTARGRSQQAFPPMSTTLLLEDDLDVSRGDMFCVAAQSAGR